MRLFSSQQFEKFEHADSGSVSKNPALATISTKPTTPEEIEAYNQLLQYEAQKFENEYSSGRRQLQQDDQDEGVFHASPSNAKSINVIVNADGSLTFSSDQTGDSATTKPTHDAGDGESVCAVGEDEVKMDDPRMVIGMTCEVCNTRLVKTMPKKSYEKGVVLIRCDGCKSSHLIADHLGWFDDGGVKGEQVVRASADAGELDEVAQRKIEETLAKARESDLNQPLAGVVNNHGSQSTESAKALP